jgi:hypothetical protein
MALPVIFASTTTPQCVGVLVNYIVLRSNHTIDNGPVLGSVFCTALRTRLMKTLTMVRIYPFQVPKYPGDVPNSKSISPGCSPTFTTTSPGSQLLSYTNSTHTPTPCNSSNHVAGMAALFRSFRLHCISTSRLPPVHTFQPPKNKQLNRMHQLLSSALCGHGP